MHAVEAAGQYENADNQVDDSLRDLYQTLIIEHGRRPRHFKSLEHATHLKSGHNPLCGDQVLLQCQIKDGVIAQAAFSGQGCAICMASCSLMLERLQGISVTAAQQLFADFHTMLTSSDAVAADLGKLEVLQGVKEYPIRVKCATLGWQTLSALLSGADGEVCTEQE